MLGCQLSAFSFSAFQLFSFSAFQLFSFSAFGLGNSFQFVQSVSQFPWRVEAKHRRQRLIFSFPNFCFLEND